jgi:hypothetical protein
MEDIYVTKYSDDNPGPSPRADISGLFPVYITFSDDNWGPLLRRKPSAEDETTRA